MMINLGQWKSGNGEKWVAVAEVSTDPKLYAGLIHRAVRNRKSKTSIVQGGLLRVTVARDWKEQRAEGWGNL